MAQVSEISPGRRLRLDRRKVGLSQQELADQIGHTLEEISAMENNRVELSASAKQFIAGVPARVPRKGKEAAGGKQRPQKPAEPAERVEEERDGPGPRVDVEPPAVAGGDRPPAAPRVPARELDVPRGEIAQLEDALLKMIAGERLVVPKQTPDGVVQVAAVIPGIAQVVAMVDEFDGQVIEVYAPGMAKAWAELARQNPAVRRVLMGLTYGGAYRGVLAASLPPMIAIMAHHGWLPGAPGRGTGEVIEQPQPEPEPQQHEWNGGVPVEVETLFDAEAGLG